MLVMQQLFFYFTIFGVTVLAGYPTAILLGDNSTNLDRIPRSLLLGSALIMLPSYWMIMFDVSMRYAAYVIFAMTVALWGMLCMKKRRELLPRIRNKELWIIITICLFAGTLAMFPLLLYGSFFPYGDAYTYYCIADYLKDHGFKTAVSINSYEPWLSQSLLYQGAGLRIGAQILLSFWTIVFQQALSVGVFTPLSAIAVCSYGMAVCYFNADRRDVGLRGSIYSVAFSACNVPVIIWCALYGFLPQLFGMAFMVAALKVAIMFAETENRINIRMLTEGALMVAAMALSYSEIVPLYALSVLCVYLYKSYLARRWVRGLCSLASLAALSLVVMAPYVPKMISAIFMQFGAVVGWDQSFQWFDYLASWFSTAPAQYSFTQQASVTSYQLGYICLTVGLGIILMVGLAHGEKRERLQEFVAASVPFGLLLVYLKFLTPNPFGNGLGNSWSVFKLSEYFFPLICCYLSPCFADTIRNSKKMSKVLSLTALVCFTLLCCVNALNCADKIKAIMREYITGEEIPYQQYMDLAEEYRGEQRVINLVGFPIPQRKVLTYYLRENRLSSDWHSDGYFASMWAHVEDPNYDPNGITLTYDTISNNAVAGTVAIPAGDYIALRDGEGVGGAETSDETGDSWTWNRVESNYYVTNYSNSSVVCMELELSCAGSDPDSKVDFYLDDELIRTVAVNSRGKTPVVIMFELEQFAEAALKLVYTGETVDGGGRPLSLMVWNTRVTVPENAMDTLFCFSASQYNATKYVVQGLSTPEEWGTWTDGDEFEMQFYLEDDAAHVHCNIDVVNTFYQPQDVTVLIGDREVFHDIIEGDEDIDFEFAMPETGVVDMTILLPDSVPPSEVLYSEDARDLGLGLLSISFAAMS